MINYGDPGDQAPYDDNGHWPFGNTWPAQIVQIVTEDNEDVFLVVNRFLRPEDLETEAVKGLPTPGRQQHHAENEVIASPSLAIVPAGIVSRKTKIAHWNERKEECPPNAELWCRQSVLDGELTELQRYCVCGQPWNPDRALYQCDSSSCKAWLHEGCMIAAFREGLIKGSGRGVVSFNVTLAAGRVIGPGKRQLVYRSADANSRWEVQARCLVCWVGLEFTPSEETTVENEVIASAAAQGTSPIQKSSQEPCRCYDSVTFPNIPIQCAEDGTLAGLQNDYDRVVEEQKSASGEVIESGLHDDPQWKGKGAMLWKRRRELRASAWSRLVGLEKERADESTGVSRPTTSMGPRRSSRVLAAERNARIAHVTGDGPNPLRNRVGPAGPNSSTKRAATGRAASPPRKRRLLSTTDYRCHIPTTPSRLRLSTVRTPTPAYSPEATSPREASAFALPAENDGRGQRQEIQPSASGGDISPRRQSRPWRGRPASTTHCWHREDKELYEDMRDVVLQALIKENDANLQIVELKIWEQQMLRDRKEALKWKMKALEERKAVMEECRRRFGSWHALRLDAEIVSPAGIW